MNSSVENLIIGLLLAAISGVTFIAYKHPGLYQKEFSPKILNSAWFVLGFAVVYEIGYGGALDKFTPLLANSDDPQVLELLESTGVNGYVFVAALAAALYSGFLTWLADHMKNEKSDDNGS